MLTIRLIEAGDAAVPSGLAAGQTVCRTISIRSALNALSTGAVCTSSALANGTASRRATRRAGCAASRVAHSDNSTARRPPRARRGRSTSARSSRLGIELEALIARRLERAEGNYHQHGTDPGSSARQIQPIHGSATSCFASRTAKPCG